MIATQNVFFFGMPPGGSKATSWLGGCKVPIVIVERQARILLPCWSDSARASGHPIVAASTDSNGYEWSCNGARSWGSSSEKKRGGGKTRPAGLIPYPGWENMTSPTLLVMYVARGAGTRLQDLVEELSAESGARRAGGDRL